ncbi:MAG: hypothetical protein KC931_25660 [Candidatus Omnitrophica bacterium]|nr:hypothetical protein [Candidatus Omnitrophota bacterium]
MYVSPGVVVGFHGCDKQVADRVLKRNGRLTPSQNSYDWLGHGIYFWEGSHDRALRWARENKKIRDAAVIGAFLRLGNCLDLLDSVQLSKVKVAYDMLRKESKALGEPMPTNRGKDDGDATFIRELDCRVIQRLHQVNNESIARTLGVASLKGPDRRRIQCHEEFIDSVRGMFPEGRELYDGAGFRDRNHIQLCIVNPNAILGYFQPLSKDSGYKPL